MGFAEGLGKPVIYTCEASVLDHLDRKPHFDTNHYLTIEWHADDRAQEIKELKAAIRETLPEEATLEDPANDDRADINKNPGN